MLDRPQSGLFLCRFELGLNEVHTRVCPTDPPKVSPDLFLFFYAALVDVSIIGRLCKDTSQNLAA